MKVTKIIYFYFQILMLHISGVTFKIRSKLDDEETVMSLAAQNRSLKEQVERIKVI